jgi:hypothetical protein
MRNMQGGQKGVLNIRTLYANLTLARSLMVSEIGLNVRSFLMGPAFELQPRTR